MRKDTDASEASRQYATAHAAHYGTGELREALELYLGIIAAHPDTQEAGYSRSQVQNIVRGVVPRQELFDAQVSCALAHFEYAGQPRARHAPVTPLASGRTFTIHPLELPSDRPSGLMRARRVQPELKEEVDR